MQVSTGVLDVLPGGTITRLKLKTEPMAGTICRNEPDQNFMIEKFDVVYQERMKKALEALEGYLYDY